MKRTRLGLVLLAFAASSIGCGGVKSPELVPCEIVVTINGIPLPNAVVTLSPMGKGYDGTATSMGTTDERGRAKLKCGPKDGACVGENKVTVNDPSPPEEARGQGGESQQIADKFMASLKNRPIPTMYQTALKSDLTVTIVQGTAEYKVDLKR